MKGIFSIRFCFCLVLLLAGIRSGPLRAQDSLALAPPPVEVRLPDPQLLDTLRADEDLQYVVESAPPDTLWQQISKQLTAWLELLFFFVDESLFWRLLYYFLGAVLVFVFLKIRKGDLAALIGRKNHRLQPIRLGQEENEQEAEEGFDALLAEAMARKEFRQVIRLRYLLSLRNLSLAQLISRQPGKTNRSYSAEIKPAPIRQEFEQLTELFEYVWYGQGPVGEELFEAARVKFDRFEALLKQHA